MTITPDVVAEINARLSQCEFDCSADITRLVDEAAYKGYVWSTTSQHQRTFVLLDSTVASAKNPDTMRHLWFYAYKAAQSIDSDRRRHQRAVE